MKVEESKVIGDVTWPEWYIGKVTIEKAAEINKKVIVDFICDVKYQGACYKESNYILYCRDKINRYPKEALRNLAIHEVCHLKHANHSKRFRNLCRKMGITEKYWLYGAPKKTPRPAYIKDL